MLEWTLIKQHRPRFNIRLRDDKSYPFLAVTVDEQFPRALVMRGRKRKGTRYFGPYAHAYAIRDTLDLLLRSFPIRTCSPGKFNEHHRLGRPCLLFHIEKCSRPVRRRDQRARLPACWSTSCATSSTATPTRSSSRLERGDARRRRRPGVRAGGAAARPPAGRAAGDREAADGRRAQRGHRRHRHRRRRARSGGAGVLRPSTAGWSAARASCSTRSRTLSPGGLVDRIMEELYGDEPPLGVPKQVLVPVESEDVATYEEWLTHLRGSRVQIRVPQRGDKRALHETVTRNAKEEFVRHRLRRAGDHNARSRALTELQDLLRLPEAPLRIECYDMAHLQGTDYVGSMVVLEDGLPNKREYRRFKVKDVPGNDDYAAMEEVLTRRLTAYLNERDRPLDAELEEGVRRGRRFPTRRSCCSSTAARASSPSPSGWSTRSAWPTRSRSPRWPSGSRRSTCPGRGDPVERAAGQRGAVHAAADPRRGAPLRQHVPPRAARQADDGELARRHPRPRRGAEEEADPGDGRRQRGEEGVTRRAQAQLPARRGGRGGLRQVPPAGT